MLEDLNKEIDDLVVIGINVQETTKQVKDYAEKNGITFQLFMDEEGEMAQTFFVSGFPTSYFVSKDGYLVGGVPGYIEEENLLGILDIVRNFDPNVPVEN